MHNILLRGIWKKIRMIKLRKPNNFSDLFGLGRLNILNNYIIFISDVNLKILIKKLFFSKKKVLYNYTQILS